MLNSVRMVKVRLGVNVVLLWIVINVLKVVNDVNGIILFCLKWCKMKF